MSRLTRRSFGGSAVAAWLCWRNAWAAAGGRPLPRTPPQSEGPFYPVRKPRNPGNNLVRAAGGGELARGQLLRLRGRVTDPAGEPLVGTLVEIWQVDHQGIYRHPRARDTERFDPAFQGYGESVTDEGGRYGFMTLVPAIYTGRPPHIHVKLKTNGHELLTTQLYLEGHPANGRDGILGRLFGLDRKVDLFINPNADGRYEGRPVKAAEFQFVV